MTDPLDQAGVPMSDEFEMELRARLTVLEQRVGLVFWFAVAAEVGVLALAVVFALNVWKQD